MKKHCSLCYKLQYCFIHKCHTYNLSSKIQIICMRCVRFLLCSSLEIVKGSWSAYFFYRIPKDKCWVGIWKRIWEQKLHTRGMLLLSQSWIRRVDCLACPDIDTPRTLTSQRLILQSTLAPGVQIQDLLHDKQQCETLHKDAPPNSVLAVRQ
jgi:hypothetical protein